MNDKQMPTGAAINRMFTTRKARTDEPVAMPMVVSTQSSRTDTSFIAIP
jgi:hypothetical protein